MKKVLSWAFAAALICGLNALTSCTNDDNPAVPSNNISEKLIGKWIKAERNDAPVPTNMKVVTTFVSPTLAYSSAAMTIFKDNPIWKDYTPFDVEIKGNLVTLTEKNYGEGVPVKDELNITAISETEMTANSTTHILHAQTFKVRYVKVTADYSDDILGAWECTSLTGGETFNDANARLEFLADGTYKYYQKNTAGEWEEITTRDFQNYFVDGNFLATRWKNADEDELREWWEINSLEDGKMQWIALRQNADGSTFQQVMDWERTPAAKTVDLATLTADYTAHDGDILTGKLAEAVQITVADGASITIADAYINDELLMYDGKDFAGITCLGDATITICGTNSISGFHTFYPAIFVPEGHTLTFQGDGILNARSNGYYSCLSAAIGSVRAGANCGNLVFLGGEIYAEGGDRSAGIGASCNSDCGDITIGGTAEIYISAPKGAAAIGSGSGVYPDLSDCGDITIGGSARIKVSGGSNSAAIGAGTFGTCGNITIGEEANVFANGINCGPGIGAGYYGTCKAITIEGGYVNATCDDYGPGIGTFYGNRSKCESITITGGIIVATGGEDGPAIGSAPENPYAIPITITSGIRKLIAIRGSELADYIGAGVDGTRGSVTIDGVENATPESTFPNLVSFVEDNTWMLISDLSNEIE